MNLNDFLAKKSKVSKNKAGDWLRFCVLDITTGSLWAGDPLLANVEDGCVVKVPPGRYVVEGVGLACGRDRTVSRLRVRLESEKDPQPGKEIGETGTDSAMIGVCDIKAFDKACKAYSADEVQESIAAQAEQGFGIITFNRLPGAVMPFVPTGSDGIGPVFALMSGRKRIGIELPFINDEVLDREEPEAVSLLGNDQDHFMTRLVDGKEVSFWVGGESCLWSDAQRGPVEYRVRLASGRVAKPWLAMTKFMGGGPTFRESVVLDAGKYEVDFRIGKEVFSMLRMTIS